MGENTKHLELKIKKLEEQIASLRLGRRVLMNLLIELEESKNKEILSLKREIRRLRRRLKSVING